MLRFTSCLFATIVLNAYAKGTRTVRIDCYHHLFLAVTVLSVLFHSTHDQRVGIVDRIFAHAAFLFVLLVDSRRAVETVWPSKADALHAGLHVVTVIGVNCFIRLIEDSEQ